MYKTIRHGENSLQYTILPQNDDFRIEGKLSSASSSCSSAAARKCKTKRPKRRSFFAYLGLIFVCTVIVGAVLIPFLVSAECLPSPTEWFLKTKAALTKSVSASNRSPSTHEQVKNVSAHIGPSNGQPAAEANIGKTVQIINANGVEKIILRVNKTQLQSTVEQSASGLNISNKEAVQEIATERSNGELDNKPLPPAPVDTAPAAQPPTLEHYVTEVRFDEPLQSADANQLAAIAPTIVVTTVRSVYAYETSNNNNDNNNKPINKLIAAIRPTTSFSTTSIYSPHAPNQSANTPQNASAPVAVPTIVTRIIQVPLLKSTAKKPIIPPALVRTQSTELTSSNATTAVANQTTTKAATAGHGYGGGSGAIVSPAVHDLTQTEQQSDWLQSHWPYIDPSSYFQWSSYKEDSVLLPALLGFALIGMILIITVCLVARNKRAIVSTVRKRNRNDVEEAGAEDNTTLLTNTNLSDED